MRDIIKNIRQPSDEFSYQLTALAAGMTYNEFLNVPYPDGMVMTTMVCEAVNKLKPTTQGGAGTY